MDDSMNQKKFDMPLQTDTREAEARDKHAELAKIYDAADIEERSSPEKSAK